MRIIALFLLIFFLVPAPGFAADPYNTKIQTLSDLNRIAPLQRPEWDSTNDILGRKIIDNKMKVVGTAKDILLSPNGNIVSMNIDFDRLRLGAPIYVDYSTLNMRPTSNGYAMDFEAQQIADIYPSLLAEVATAAGTDEDTVSLDRLRGLEVWAEDGRRIGALNDVLFGGDGNRAEALYVSMTYGTLRGETIAIPFNQGKVREVSAQRRMYIPDDMADAMIAYVHQGKK